MTIRVPKPPVLLCYHCGNRTPHRLLLPYEAELQYEVYKKDRYLRPFDYCVLACTTCEGLSLVGGFRHELTSMGLEPSPVTLPRLYPRGPSIIPPAHTVSGLDIPLRALALYEDAWPLRHTVPSAFANQIRRALEIVCKDKGGRGRNLASQLEHLASSGVLPPGLAEMADLVRELGNRGSHAGAVDVDIYDAELMDELFRSILHYVYVGPAHVRRLRERLAVGASSTSQQAVPKHEVT